MSSCTHRGCRTRPIRLQGIQRYNPWRDSRAEVLTIERPEWCCFGSLNVPGRPIVQEYDAKDVLFCLIDWNGCSLFITFADEGCELELEIEFLAGPKCGCAIHYILASRSMDRRPRDHDRRGAAMVAERHVEEAGGQLSTWPDNVRALVLTVSVYNSLLREASGNSTNILSMVRTCEKVGIVADVEWEMHLNFIHRDEGFPPDLLVVP